MSQRSGIQDSWPFIRCLPDGRLLWHRRAKRSTGSRSKCHELCLEGQAILRYTWTSVLYDIQVDQQGLIYLLGHNLPSCPGIQILVINEHGQTVRSVDLNPTMGQYRRHIFHELKITTDGRIFVAVELHLDRPAIHESGGQHRRLKLFQIVRTRVLLMEEGHGICETQVGFMAVDPLGHCYTFNIACHCLFLRIKSLQSNSEFQIVGCGADDEYNNETEFSWASLNCVFRDDYFGRSSVNS